MTTALREMVEEAYDTNGRSLEEAALAAAPRPSASDLTEKLHNLANLAEEHRRNIPGWDLPKTLCEYAERSAAMEAALKDVRDNGLIYWEPQTTRGRIAKSGMIDRINRALGETS